MKPVALLAILVFAANAYPCSCAYPDFQDQMLEASLVFSGKVTAIEPAGNNQNAVQFAVIKSYKGTSEKKLEVRTAETTDACGFHFDVNQEYLVYAAGNKPEVSLCSRTRLLKEAAGDLRNLENGERKDPDRDPFVEMKGERPGSRPNPPKELNVTQAVIVGITKKSDGYVALIRATNNRVYFLKVGDKLSDGVVMRVDTNTVTFRQYKGYRSVLVRKQLRPFPD
jgi:hypothetical protein